MCIFWIPPTISSTRWRFWSLLFRRYPQRPQQCLAHSGISANEQIQGNKPRDVLESASSGWEWEWPQGGWAIEDMPTLSTSAACSALSTPFPCDFTAHKEGFETGLSGDIACTGCSSWQSRDAGRAADSAPVLSSEWLVD